MYALLLLLTLLSCTSDADRRGGGGKPVPVELAAVDRGAIAGTRTFSGSLESSAEITVHAQVSGRVARLPLALGDAVSPGEIVAVLDRGEYRQAVIQAGASLAAAEASLAEASVQAELAQGRLERMEELFAQGAVSGLERDDALAQAKQREAARLVADAEVTRAVAAVSAANAALDATELVAQWSGEEPRLVAERLVDEGTFVASNTALVRIVDLDPLRGVLFVTEKDYPHLRLDQDVSLSTDAFPGQTFPARVARIAPVFDATTRQARVELQVPNPDGRLRPGQFVQARVVLDEVPDATVVPAEALVRREGADAVYVVSPDGGTALLRPVTVGLRDGERVQVTGEGVSGQVVVLGQHLLHDGASVTAQVGAE